jgi:DNA-binding LacI/PurR family transcriptional regulator
MSVKYQKLQERIIADIASGVYSAGEKLPSCRAMAREFGVSYLTVISATRGLEERGYVKRSRGSGVYVADPAKRVPRIPRETSGNVGALMALSGDLFQNFAETFVNALESKNHHLTPLPTQGVFGVQSLAERESKIAGFAERGLDALVVEGTRHAPYRLLKKHEAGFRDLTFVIHYESGIDFPNANSVVCDYLRVGELAAEHLLEAGCAKIAMIVFEPISEMERRRNGTSRETHESRVMDGIESVFASAGLDFIDKFNVITDETSTSGEESLVAKVADAINDGFDGFFCMGDHRARGVHKAAERLNVGIGEDVKVLGMYATKWRGAFSPPLPSISVNEREIAEIAAELITSGRKGERVVVEPRLVPYESISGEGKGSR